MKYKFFILGLTAIISKNTLAATIVKSGTDCGTNCSYSIDSDGNLKFWATNPNKTAKVQDYGYTNINQQTYDGGNIGITRAPWGSYNVTSVEFSADVSDKQGNITSHGISSIGKNAFIGMSSIKSITIPSTVQTVGPYAFEFASGVENVSIDPWSTTIGTNAFKYCTGTVTNLTFPEGVTTIPSYAFDGRLAQIKSIVIPDTVKTINQAAFRDYADNQVESIIIPEGVETIGGDAFFGLKNVKSLVIPDSVQTVGSWAFAHMDGLTSLTIPDGMTITNNTFYWKEKTGNEHFTAVSDLKCSAAQLEAFLSIGNGQLKASPDGKINIICTSGDCETYLRENSKYKNNATILAALNFIDPNQQQTTQDGAQPSHIARRIYTVEEARQAVEAAGTDTVNFRIRYK